jgi:hypothetical protein
MADPLGSNWLQVANAEAPGIRQFKTWGVFVVAHTQMSNLCPAYTTLCLLSAHLALHLECSLD